MDTTAVANRSLDGGRIFGAQCSPGIRASYHLGSLDGIHAVEIAAGLGLLLLHTGLNARG
jgi:hypothetical protein